MKLVRLVLAAAHGHEDTTGLLRPVIDRVGERLRRLGQPPQCGGNVLGRLICGNA